MVRSRRRRRFGFEALEERTVLAGNVTAALVGGVLEITETTAGSEVGNALLVEQTAAGVYRVTALDGENLVPVGDDGDGNFVGVTDIDIDLLGGDDYLELMSLSVPDALAGDVAIRTGSGEDTVYVHDLALTGGLDIDVGADADIVSMEFFDVAGNVSITSSAAAGTIEEIAAFAGHVGGNLEIATGDSIDFVGVVLLEIDGSLGISTGAGDDFTIVNELDVQGNLAVSGGSDSDFIDLLTVDVAGTVMIFGGDGADEINVGFLNADVDSPAGDGLFILSGGGDDILHLYFNTVDNGTFIATGGGDDTALVEFSTLSGGTVILLQAGDDNLTLADTELNGFILTSGGGGSDTIDDATATINSFYLKISFETDL